jgi:hypothetical protein
MCAAWAYARAGTHVADIGFNADTTLFVAAFVGGFVVARFAALATCKPAASLKSDSNTYCHHYVH